MSKIPTENDFKIASKFYNKGRKSEETGNPNDEEVVACEKVFRFFIDIGQCFGQDMLTAWGISNFVRYERICHARKLKTKG